MSLFVSNEGEQNEVCCSRKGFREGGRARLHQWSSLSLDHSRLNVKGGHPPRFLLFDAVKCFLFRNLLACPRNTPNSRKIRDSASLMRSYSQQHGTTWKHTDTRREKKSADNKYTELEEPVSWNLLDWFVVTALKSSFCCFSRRDSHVTLKVKAWNRRGDWCTIFNLKLQRYVTFFIQKKKFASLNADNAKVSQSPLLLHVSEVMCTHLSAYKSWNRSHKAWNVLNI